MLTLQHSIFKILQINDGINRDMGPKLVYRSYSAISVLFYDRSVFLVFRTSLFCSYSSTRAVFLPKLQHHDKATSRRMFKAFDIQEFRTAEGVFYDCLACKRPIFSVCKYRSVSCFIQFLLQFQSFQRNIIVAFYDVRIFLFFVVIQGLHRFSPTIYTTNSVE